jgi:hypothetical protein
MCPHIISVRYRKILSVPDLHFFQVIGIPLYENVPIMKKVAEVYFITKNMFPEKDITILDDTSLTDMSDGVILPKLS